MNAAQPIHPRQPRRVLFLYTLTATALLAWGVFSIYPRARLDPAHPELHMTDFTVFTTAAPCF